MIRALLGQIRVEAVRHYRRCVGLAVEHRQLRRHILRLRNLIFSAVRHYDRARADRAVELLDESALGADVEVGDKRFHRVGDAESGQSRRKAVEDCIAVDRLDFDCSVFLGSIRAQEFARQVDNIVVVPLHAQSRFLGDYSYNCRFEVFARRVFTEFFSVVARDDYRHALLRLGDRELGAVESLVFLRYARQVDVKPVGELAYRDRDSARAEVVAAFYQTGDVGVAEETLKLALLGRISLLHLRAAGSQRIVSVSLR